MKTSKTGSERRQYDAAFKAKILQLHKQGRSVSSLAAAFGIKDNVIYRWRKKACEASSEAVSEDVQAELKALRVQVQELEIERDILKKALGIFSRQI